MNAIQIREQRTQHFIHSAVFLKQLYNIVELLKDIKHTYIGMLKELPNSNKSSISIREIDDLMRQHSNSPVYVAVLSQLKEHIKQQNEQYYRVQKLQQHIKENIKLLKKKIKKLQRLYKDIRDNKDIDYKTFSFLQSKPDVIRVYNFSGFISFQSRVRHILKCLTLL